MYKIIAVFSANTCQFALSHDEKPPIPMPVTIDVKVQIRLEHWSEFWNKIFRSCYRMCYKDHLLFYFTSYVLNMFRTLIYPSSGACDYSVELPHWSLCSVKTEDLALE